MLCSHPLVNMGPTENFSWSLDFLNLQFPVSNSGLCGFQAHLLLPSTWRSVGRSCSSLPGTVSSRGKPQSHFLRAVDRQLLHRKEVDLGGTSRVVWSFYTGVDGTQKAILVEVHGRTSCRLSFLIWCLALSHSIYDQLSIALGAVKLQMLIISHF